MFFIWLLIGACVALGAWLYRNYTTLSYHGIKHGPFVPLLGDMAGVTFLKEHVTDVIMRAYNSFPNERLVGRYEFLTPYIIVKDPELLKRITVKDFDHFVDRRIIVDAKAEPMFGRNLVSLRGQEWKDMRSMMSPAFTSSKIRNMLPLIVEVGDQMMVSLKKQLKESGRDYIDVDVRALATRYANDVIASCAFGLRVDSHSDPDNEFFKMGAAATNYTFTQILKFFGHSAFPGLMKRFGIKVLSDSTRAFFNHLVWDTMREREQHGIVRPDMIHLLMEAKKGRLTHDDSGKDADAGFATVEESDVGKKSVHRDWSDTDLTAQAFIFFLAGFETVSTAMSFLMYELALNPEVQDKLVKEIREQEKTGKFDYGAIQRMTYLDMVVSETLRRWPAAVATDRLCIKDYNLGRPNDEATTDYIIKAGESLTIPITAFHYDPQYFPDPMKFDPERFSEVNKHKIKPSTYMPFGIGPRNCIGSRFALCEVKVMIYQLLLHVELSPCEKTTIPAKLTTDTVRLRLEGGHYLRMKMIFLIWLVAITAAVLLYCHQSYSRFSKYGVKHLPPVPLLGDMARVFFRREHFFENAKRIYDSFPGERFVGHVEFVRPMVFLRDLELVKRITVKDFEHFLDHAVVVDKTIDPLFGRNLFALKGQEWKDMRSTLSPAFTSSKIKLMVPFMEEAGENMTIRLKREIQESGKNYADVDFKDVCNRYANDVIASCAFGLKVDSQNNEPEFYKMGKVAAQLTYVQMLKFMGFQCIPTIMKYLKMRIFTASTQNFFRQLVTQTMRERETHNIIRPDILHLLMEVKKGNLKHEEDNTASDAGFATVEESNVGKAATTKSVWTDDDLIAQAVIFFVAGFEGVAQAMTFLVYELTLNPEAQDKLVQEIMENERRNGGKFNYTSVQEMTYLDMVVSELLRLWTPGIALERICTKDYNLGRPNDKATKDYIIRKGEGVKIPTGAFHLDPQYFPEPHKFDPERFAPENRHKIHPFSFNPFGCGPRNCIASRFALCEVKVLIYQVLKHVEVSPCEKTVIPIQLDKTSFNLIIKGGHWIRVKARG
ncbi:uncharacterized protein LOC134667798 [Cydia fagiglandana]|uniref:uncharacterized protein LOC134667798 n=1 Tax=Cydia fagiglandana TaxID=1458189 RepID=UPI002FEE55B9